MCSLTFSRKLVLLAMLMACSLWPGVQSQDPTPNCTVTVPLTAPITIVPPGDACISCVFNNTLATDAVFNGIEMNPDSVQVEGGVLMVYDTEVTFGGAESGTGSTSTAYSLSCTDGIDNITAAVFVESFEPPVITGESTIVEGNDLLLKCNAPISITFPFLLWLDPAGKVITQQTVDLVIANFTRDMAGIYTCVTTYTITTSFTMNATASVLVQISDLPAISGETTITEGGTLNLVCRGTNSSAVPQPTLQWFSPTGAELSASGNLQIANVTRHMMGAYTCVATDPTTSATTNSTAIVIIQYPPVVVVISDGGTLVVSEGDTLQLTCLIVGNPSPNYVSWTRGGIPLSNSSSDQRVTVETYSTSSTTLTIVGVCGSEGGEYTCSAVSAVGTGSETTSVAVQGDVTRTIHTQWYTCLTVKSLNQLRMM
jgi:hypothetical protein